MLHAVVFAAALVAFKGTVVVQHATGVEEPVYGALVTLGDRTAMTLPDGSFEIDGAEPGTYPISVHANAGQMHGIIDIGIGARKLTLLDPGCWAMYGKVRDADTGAPVTHAKVDYIGSALTDGNGDYFIRYGCSSEPGFRFHGSFFYSIAAPGYCGVSEFGGRAEYVSGVTLRDFTLLALRPPRCEGRLRPSPAP
jgi:hypothetical protein